MSTAEYCRVSCAALYGVHTSAHSLCARSLLTSLTAQVYLSPAYVEEQNSWLEIRRSTGLKPFAVAQPLWALQSTN